MIPNRSLVHSESCHEILIDTFECIIIFKCTLANDLLSINDFLMKGRFFKMHICLCRAILWKMEEKLSINNTNILFMKEAFNAHLYLFDQKYNLLQ